jgi:histidine decarboxylase
VAQRFSALAPLPPKNVRRRDATTTTTDRTTQYLYENLLCELSVSFLFFSLQVSEVLLSSTHLVLTTELFHSTLFLSIVTMAIQTMLSRVARQIPSAARKSLSAKRNVFSASLQTSALGSVSTFANDSAAIIGNRQIHSTSTGSSSKQIRTKSTAVDEQFELEGEPIVNIDVSGIKAEVHHMDASAETDTDGVRDYTSDKTKSGTPSPWAVFDAWGAGDDIHAPLDAMDEMKLAPESVKIPTTEEERETMTNETDILKAYDNLLKARSSVHFGYPYNLMYNHEELYQFMKYSINNLGDPFITSNYGVHSRQFECSVIDFFADLWQIDKGDYWGYVTTCGTEGNLHGILLARECHPDGILYSSKETHYSIFKAARYYRMDAKAIPTLPMGEIDYDILADEIEKNRDRPVIINVNIGTTVKGAVDNLDRILRILNNLNIPRERYHIHCDGALFAMMMPFVDFAPEISFRKPIDSIAVSGHKMLGCPMPCGVTIARKEHVKKVEQKIEYLNSVDTTIMGSRNGQAALYLWYSLRKKGVSGIKRDVV